MKEKIMKQHLTELINNKKNDNSKKLNQEFPELSNAQNDIVSSILNLILRPEKLKDADESSTALKEIFNR
jgi:hypothetical protein